MPDNYSTLELRVIESAVAFIRSRDAKSKANTERNKVKCSEASSASEDDFGVSPCWSDFHSGLIGETDLCEKCKQRVRLTHDAEAASKLSTKSLRTLRRSVYALDKANCIATERKARE